jgi:hypothetical protein
MIGAFLIFNKYFFQRSLILTLIGSSWNGTNPNLMVAVPSLDTLLRRETSNSKSGRSALDQREKLQSAKYPISLKVLSMNSELGLSTRLENQSHQILLFLTGTFFITILFTDLTVYRVFCAKFSTFDTNFFSEQL